MYDADKVLVKAKERAARAHDSDLDALVAKTDAEAATVVYERAKARVHTALEELRSVFLCCCCRNVFSAGKGLHCSMVRPTPWPCACGLQCLPLLARMNMPWRLSSAFTI